MKTLLLFAALLFCTGTAHSQAGERVWIIDTAGAGGDVDFQSLNSWDAAKARDLTAADTNYVATCRASSGVAHGAYTAGAGWDTDPTRDVKIWTDPADVYRHNGTYQTGNKFRIEHAATAFSLSNIDFVRVAGLQWQMTTTLSNRFCILISNGTGNQIIEQCIFKGVLTGTATSDYGIFAQGNGGGLVIQNNLFYGWKNGTRANYGIHVAGTGKTVSVYNNTAFDCWIGYNGGNATETIKNCLAASSSSVSFSGTWTVSDYNASEDGNHPGGNGQTGAAVFVSETPGSEDLHLDSFDTVAQDNGLTIGSVTEDIDGDSRPQNSVYDIGADEVLAAAGALGQFILIGN